MAVIALPTCPPIVGKNWRYQASSQVNRSVWTGVTKKAINAAAPRWTAEIKAFELDEAEHFWAWNAFLAKLDGRANSFRLPVVSKPQITGVTILVNGGGQTGFTLATDGWGDAGLKAGQWFTVEDQLMRLKADVVPVAGAATLNFDRWLRHPPADAAVVTVDIPTGLMSLADDAAGFDDDSAPDDFYGEGSWTIGFQCEEAF